MMCVCLHKGQRKVYPRERFTPHSMFRFREICSCVWYMYIHARGTTEQQSLLTAPLRVVSPAIFFLRSVFGKSPPFLHTHSGLPPSFQNKAAVSESMLHLVKANAREKHKAPGLTKFLTTLFPKQPFWIFFLCTLSIKHALSTAFVNMAMSARKKQLQYVSTGCLCFTAVNTSFIWGFTVNHLCNLLSAHFWFAYCNPREAIHRWAACRMSRFAYVSTSLNLANLR